MSPLEIPGTSINIPYPPGKDKCSSCKRDFDEPKPKKTGDTVTVHCPWCNYTLKVFSAKVLESEQQVESDKKK